MRKFDVKEVNELRKGKCLVVFSNGDKFEGNVFAMCKEVNGEIVETGEKAVMYAVNTSCEQVSYYMQ